MDSALPSKQTFINAVECPICLEVATPPIILCKTGHLICGVCRKKVNECRICRAEFTTTRNFAVESMIADLKIKCYNAKCREMIKTGAMTQHKETYEFRPIICNRKDETACPGTEVKWEEFVDHLRQIHDILHIKPLPSVFGNSYSINCLFLKGTEDIAKIIAGPAQYWRTIILEYDDNTFFLEMRQEKSEVFIWVTVLLTETQCEIYSADVQISKMEDTIHGLRRLNWSLCIAPPQKLLKDLKYSKYCAVIPFQSLGLFSSESGSSKQQSFCLQVRFQKHPKLNFFGLVICGFFYLFFFFLAIYVFKELRN